MGVAVSVEVQRRPRVAGGLNEAKGCMGLKVS